ncbi:MAG: penicillin acylase family protein [Comamonadaceae bacterium]|nr:penicillin acylase family protein [Comamonadaceae bacterium]
MAAGAASAAAPGASPTRCCRSPRCRRSCNPPAGWFVNANNDPAGLTLDNDPLDQLRPGGGIYYLAYAWDRGYRAGRITQRLDEYLLAARRQDVVREDAGDPGRRRAARRRVFRALDRAGFPPRPDQGRRTRARRASLPIRAIEEAVRRFAAWDRSTPTGLQEGWDAGKPAGERPETGQHPGLGGGLDLRRLAQPLHRQHGGCDAATASRMSGVTPPAPGNQEVLSALQQPARQLRREEGQGRVRRRLLRRSRHRRRQRPPRHRHPQEPQGCARPSRQRCLQAGVRELHPSGRLSLGQAAPHRVPPSPRRAVLDSARRRRVPAAAGRAGRHSDRRRLPDRRRVVPPGARRGCERLHVRRRTGAPLRERAGAAPPRSESIWPGGTSGVLGSPFYFQFLEKWLANEAIPLHLGSREVRPFAEEVEKFVPPAAPGRG